MSEINAIRTPDIYELLANIKMNSSSQTSDTAQNLVRLFNNWIQTQPPSDLVWDMQRPPETITWKILNAAW